MTDLKLFICKVTIAQGPNIEPDSNGNLPFYLNPLKGSLPQRARIFNGTIGKNQNVDEGKIYAFKVSDLGERTFENRRTGEEQTATQYSHEIIGDALSVLDAARLAQLSEPYVVKVERGETTQVAENQASKSKEVPV